MNNWNWYIIHTKFYRNSPLDFAARISFSTCPLAVQTATHLAAEHRLCRPAPIVSDHVPTLFPHLFS